MRCSMIAAMITALALMLSAPQFVQAASVTLVVEHNPTDSSHFSTIQAAVTHADLMLRNAANKDTFRVLVMADPVPYSGPVTAISNVPIVGSSTAGTFLSGGGSGAVITLTNVSNVAIRNFTFLPGTGGISVNGGSSIDITNNIFELGAGATAVQVSGSSSASVTNNTFFNNGTAISTNSDVTISNDIFSTNTVAIAAQAALSNLSYNDFFNNVNDGVADRGAHSIPSLVVPNPNPLFVDPGTIDPKNRDFHLQADSPCKNSGNPKYPNSFDSSTSDMGAYGGPFSDATSTAVSGVTAALVPGTSNVLVSWQATSDSSVTAYRIYYGTSASDLHGTQAAEGPSPVQVPSGTTQATLTNLNLPAPAAPAAPALTSIVPMDRALQVSWGTVAGATGYRVFYSSAPFDATTLPATSVTVNATTTSVTLQGLSNGTTYHVAVAALAQAQIFVAVTAVKDTNLASAPGGANETPLSQVASQGVGTEQVSPLSDHLQEFPSAVTPYPNLKGEGCFIATAAYGFYSAPQVQALRSFRDRYLLTNAPGRAFVTWYYRHGPRAAHYLNQHPWLKAPVRMALAPLVLGAIFLVYTPPLMKTALMMIAVVVGDFLLRRKQRKLMVEAGEIR